MYRIEIVTTHGPVVSAPLELSYANEILENLSGASQLSVQTEFGDRVYITKPMIDSSVFFLKPA